MRTSWRGRRRKCSGCSPSCSPASSNSKPRTATSKPARDSIPQTPRSHPRPIRRQVAEIPPIRPHVIEYRQHTLTCRRCGGSTTGEPPPGTPAGAFGPRLSAMVGLLSGVYRLGKRPVRQLLADLFGLSISTGMICKLQRRAADLLTPAYDELCHHVCTQDVHLDET